MRNLVITGFMGTGKTSVGREVAQRLGRPFVDMDAESKVRAGKSIPRIFAEDGESAFRKMEAALCEELSTQEGLVIATGGGTLVDPTNRERMMVSGTVVCLTCGVEEILRRVSEDDPDRPLLDVDDPRAEVERLLAVRRETYAAVPWQIDTAGLTVEEIADKAIAFASTITLPVRYPCNDPIALRDGEYLIHIGGELLAHIGGALRATGAPEGVRVAIVSNPIVAPLYGAQAEEALRAAGFAPFPCSIPDGEQHKTLTTVAALYEQFLKGGLDRNGIVLSLGGGVTGDVAGFAAASFMRGVRFAQVPTTLLAMVDASVGGKTGVDLPQGKNLVGVFKQPEVVVIDPTVLATLPVEELRCGLAEVVKHGIIGAPGLFAELEAEGGALSPWWGEGAVARIAPALHVKIEVVEADPFERGWRAVLNLGHTTGHALEKLSDFSLRHGEAISVGMVAAARIAVELGRANPSLAERIEAVLSAWELPVRCPPFEADRIQEAMAHDKKRRAQAMRWILPRAVGEVEIAEDVPPDIVRAVLHNMGAR